MRRLPVLALIAAAFAELPAQCPPGSYGNPGNPPTPTLPPAPPVTRWTPSDTPGPAGPTTPRPAGPTAPRPNAPTVPVPTTGGPALPTAPAAAGPRSPRGFQIEEDMTTWDHWWEFNQDGFLGLHQAAAKIATTGNDQFYLGATRRAEGLGATTVDHATVVGTILPALKQALDDSAQREVTTACLLALGRIGAEMPQWRLVDVLAARVGDADQTVRENAALAVGLAAATNARAVDHLVGLALDDEHGRKLRGEEVEDRTRAFALYGLGLAAGASADFGVKERALETAAKLLADPRNGSRNIKIAAVHAIGSLGVAGRKYQEIKLADRALQVLGDYFAKDNGAGERFVQAHVPTALARLLGRDHARSDAVKQLLMAELDRKDGRRTGHAVAQSCALALGQLLAPNDDDDKANADVAGSKLLREVAVSHRDAQTRNFAVLALGQIGGACNRKALLDLFDRASQAQEKPWCALALGVMAFTRGEAGRATTGTFVTDRFVCDTLADAVKKTKDPMVAGAFAVASGLAGADEAKAVLQQRLLASTSREKLAGELAIALALLGDTSAPAVLQRVATEASQRPELLEQAAVALGRLGDPTIAPLLERRLQQDSGNVAAVQAAASALARIGDHRSVAALVTVLRDTARSSAQRAGAAQALGGIADPRALPWNTPYSANTNYRAAAETLSDRYAGVLDLL